VKHDVYDLVHFRKVTVTISGQAVAVRGWICGDFVAVTGGQGWGWKVHRLNPGRDGDNVSTELVRGLDRDTAIGIVHDAHKAGATRLKDLQAILRVHLGSFAL
jgi:hypothetical protein